MSRPDVLFLVLDSARPGRISTYGHERETTPTLDRLAERSTVFENAFAPAPWTLPSHCSMFTGLSPSEHGITNGFTDESFRLPSSIPTLAERLSEEGYRTAGFSNNPWVGTVSGLHRGFEEYVEWDLEISEDGTEPIHDRRDRALSKGHSLLGHAARQPLFLLKRRFFTSRLVERANRWLDSVLGGPEPSFTFLNLMEAHSPYFPPASAFRELDLPTPSPIEPRILNTKLLAFVLGKADLSEDLRERVLEYYDASLRYQDRKVNELLTTLEAHDAFEDTLVVICSDHGKNLGDYDRDVTPPHYLRDVNTDVLLMTKAPGQEFGDRATEPAELARLYDLIADGQQDPRETLTTDGHALVEDFIPHTGRTATDVTRWRALCDGEYRYLRGEDGSEHLFRPAGADEDDARTMREWMRESMDARVESLSSAAESEEGAADLDGSVEAQLSDLGYLE